MTFTPRGDTVFREIAALRPVVRAFRKLGKPVVLVPAEVPDAATAYRIAQAQRIPGSITVLALIDAASPAVPANCHVDCVLALSSSDLFPAGIRTRVCGDDGFAEDLTVLLKLVNIVAPTDLFLSEKDYLFLLAAQYMITDFNLDLRVHGVPTLREPDGLALDPRNRELSAGGRESALAISAALAAGAHAAEGGKDAVLAAARAVLAASPELTVESLEVRGPEFGDARLLITASIEGITLSDNAGLPLGIGFKSLADQA